MARHKGPAEPGRRPGSRTASAQMKVSTHDHVRQHVTVVERCVPWREGGVASQRNPAGQALSLSF